MASPYLLFPNSLPTTTAVAAHALPALGYQSPQALLSFHEILLDRIRFESRLWSLRSALAAVEDVETRAREAQVEAEAAVEKAKKKTEDAAREARTIKVELRFVTEKVAELTKHVEAYKAEMCKAPEPDEAATTKRSAADVLMQNQVVADMYPDWQRVRQPELAQYEQFPDKAQDPHIKQEYRPALPSQPQPRAPTPMSASTASAPRQSLDSRHLPPSLSLQDRLRFADQSSSLGSLAPNDTDLVCQGSWDHVPSVRRSSASTWSEAGTPVPSTHPTQEQTALLPPFLRATLLEPTPATSTTAASDADKDKEEENPHEARSKRLITAVKDLTGSDPEYFFTEGRTFFLAGPLAAVFSPSLKDPNKAASAHARKYGCDASGQFREGVRKQGGRWAMTVEAFEDYVLSHLRSPRFIKY